MRHPLIYFAAGLGIVFLTSYVWSESGKVLPAPNGITMPEGYKNWRLIAPSHRTDNNTLRVVLGNDIAIEAARTGKTNPWPDGAILGKVRSSGFCVEP